MNIFLKILQRSSKFSIPLNEILKILIHILLFLSKLHLYLTQLLHINLLQILKLLMKVPLNELLILFTNSDLYLDILDVLFDARLKV